MIRILRGLAHKYFSDEEAVILFLLILAGVVFVILFGSMLAPAIASVIIAFILQGLVTKLNRMGVPEIVAIVGVFVGFLGVLIGFLFGLLPLLWAQVASLAGEAPR
ncbi:AI-2E family transporter, partial [Marinobacter sp.]